MQINDPQNIRLATDILQLPSTIGWWKEAVIQEILLLSCDTFKSTNSTWLLTADCCCPLSVVLLPANSTEQIQCSIENEK